MNNLIAACFLTVASIFTPVSEETIAKQYNIAYPIVELGGCVNTQDCKEYCEIPLHYEACNKYAQNKGFQKDKEKELLNLASYAKKELSCDSPTSCQQTCSEEANIPKCTTFAQKHEVLRVDPQETKLVIQKAKEFLGCSSTSTCRSFCDKPENQNLCSGFARTMDMKGGFVLLGPEGCNSSDSCKRYCDEHESECQTYYKGISLASCTKESYWDGKVCVQAPSVEQWSSDPKSYCVANTGCSWTGTSCSCSQNTTSVSDKESICKQTSGCSWNGTACLCLNPTPTPQTCSNGRYWNGSACVCENSKVWNGENCVALPTATPTSSTSSSSNSSSGGQSGSCSQPSGGCGADRWWDPGQCRCETPEECTSMSTSCSFSNGTCSCINSQNTTCTQPSGGCGTNNYWDSTSCSCKSYEQACNETSGCTWTGSSCNCSGSGGSGGGGGNATCSEPSGGCGTEMWWDQGACTCKTQTQCLSQGCTWTGTTCQCGTLGESTTNVTFPVSELGSCSNCGSCQEYCSKDVNKEACISFAKTNKLVQNIKLEQTKLLASAATELGCTTEDSCRDFCKDIKNQTACKTFTDKYNIEQSGIVNPPKITSDLTGKTLNGPVTITASGVKNSSVELYLQSEDHPTDLLFVGRFGVNYDGTGMYIWNTITNTNGIYKLIAKTVKDGVASNSYDFLKITVNNPDNLPLEETVYSSDFKPEAVPVSNKVAIEKIKNETNNLQKEVIAVSGKTFPNSLVTILIYSNPIVVTVRSDVNGVWRYNLDKPLEPGKHVAYAAITTPDGSKIRSEVASFIVRPASAASPENESLTLESAYENTQLVPFARTAAGIIALGTAIVLLVFIKKRQIIPITNQATNNPPNF